MCSPSAIWMKLAHYDPTSIIKLWNSTCIFSKWCQMGRDPLAARASKRYISTDSLRFHIRVLWTLPDLHTHTNTYVKIRFKSLRELERSIALYAHEKTQSKKKLGPNDWKKRRCTILSLKPSRYCYYCYFRCFYLDNIILSIQNIFSQPH